MAYGSHWEWRGFGAVSSRFVKQFARLETIYPQHEMTDCYLWFPGITVNAKLRQGAENGFKFKRLERKAGDFEAWTESEDDFFPFPLTDSAKRSLLNFLHESGLEKPDTSLPRPANRKNMEEWLRKAGCRFVTVKKTRESKIWHSRHGPVLVEWACIRSPQVLTSIGLENQPSDDGSTLADSERKALDQALEEFALEEEPLTAMNYMKAIEIWAGNNKI